MKTIRFPLSLFFLWFLQTGVVNAQWQPTNGPYGGLVHALVVSGDNLFAGFEGGGVFRSTDNGTTWTAANNGLAIMDVYTLAVSSTGLYAGTRDGVFVSVNKGTSWSDKNTGLTNRNVNALAVSGPKIFAGTNGGGVYQLDTDAEDIPNWTRTGMTSGNVSALAVSGANVFAGTSNGVSLSSDNGMTWKLVSTGLPNGGSVDALLVNGTNLYAGLIAGPFGSNLGVYLSTNNGSSWKAINGSLPSPLRVYSLAASTDYLIAGTQLGVVYSTDNGTSWSFAGPSQPPMTVYSLAVMNGVGLFAGSENGVFYLINNESNWKAVDTGIIYGNVKALVVKSGDLYAGTGSGVYRSSDGGADWTPMSGGLRHVGVNTLCAVDTLLLAGNSDGVFAYTNVGWPGIAGSPTYVNSLVANGNKIFAGTMGNGVFISADRGAHWSPAANTGLTNKAVLTLAVSGPNLLAGTDDGGVFLSTNDGSNWVNTGLTNNKVISFSAAGTKLFAGIENGGVFVSNDNGASWMDTRPDASDIRQTVWTLAAHDTLLFVGTRNGVFVSANGGAHWKAVSTALTSQNVYSFIIIGADLFAGTDGGVWKRSLSDLLTGVRKTTEEIPAQFSLAQNYPNPFNPSTTIRFSLPRAAHVSLMIYNEEGQEVTRLVSRDMSAGAYQVQWNASDFADGEYFCRIEAGRFVDTKKLVLIR
jgi:hypothetical protein